MASFTPTAITDERVLSLIPRVSYVERTYSPRPDSFGGGVRVDTTDGHVLEADLRHQRGGAEIPDDGGGHPPPSPGSSSSG